MCQKTNELVSFKVSVAMITYGQEHFIGQAIEGVLSQECKFDVELIVADDCSPDNTEQVVNKIKKEHPNGHWIKYVKHEKNKGVAANFGWSLKEGKGKYIAICEGDDYWTDKTKLQKQVDILENDSSYSMVCHATEEVNDQGEIFNIANRRVKEVDLQMVLREGWFIRTASMLFKRIVIDKEFPDFFYSAYSTDYILQIMILKEGKAKYLSTVMSAYRNHLEGYSHTNPENQLLRWKKKIELLGKLDEYTAYEHSAQIDFQLQTIKSRMAVHGLTNPFLIQKIGYAPFIGYFLQRRTLKLLLNKIYLKLKTK